MHNVPQIWNFLLTNVRTFSLILLATGGKDYDNATEWLKMKFTSLNKNPEKNIYTHLTCATDTNNIKFTFDSVAEIILFKTLQDNVLL